MNPLLLPSFSPISVVPEGNISEEDDASWSPTPARKNEDRVRPAVKVHLISSVYPMMTDELVIASRHSLGVLNDPPYVQTPVFRRKVRSGGGRIREG